MDAIQQFTRQWTEALPSVRGFIAAAVPDYHAAEDLTQEVAVALLNQFEQGHVPDSFVRWAIGIARNKVLMHYRAGKRSLIVLDEELLAAAADAWEEMLPEMQPRTIALGDCVKQLPGRAGELVQLRYLEALKPEQIATRLGMSAVAVRVALNRIRAALRACIERTLANETHA